LLVQAGQPLEVVVGVDVLEIVVLAAAVVDVGGQGGAGADQVVPKPT
jgi:hypothetical protein